MSMKYIGLYLVFLFLLFAGCRTVPSPNLADGLECEEIEAEATNHFDDVTMLMEVLFLAKQNFVEDVAFRDLVYMAADGMLQEMDENSSFLQPDESEDLEEETKGEFCGVGVTVDSDDEGVMRVLATIDDSPAFHAGVLAGDAITAIDGTNVVGTSMDVVLKMMRGEEGSTVTLGILRDQDKELEFKLVRKDIHISGIRPVLDLGNGIGYVRIAQFNQNLPEEFAKVLKQFREKKVKGIILDVRDNPGGLLLSATGVAEQLLKRGKTIVFIEGRRKDEDEPGKYTAGRCEIRDTKTPIIMLVNGSSASASEILTGALRDHMRAVVVGTQTYGKASVQSVIPLESRPDCAIRLTTAYYLTPKRKEIHGEGLSPDFEVEIDSDEWNKIRQRLVEGKGFKGVCDPQLEKAVELLKGMIPGENK